MNALLDLDDVGIALRLPNREVKRMARTGKLPSVLLPDGDLRFRRDELAEWIDQLQRPAQRKGPRP